MARKRDWGIVFDKARFKEAQQFWQHASAAIAREGNAGRLKPIADRINKAFQACGMLLRDKARQNAAAAGVPRRIYTGSRPAIFAYLNLQAPKDPKKKGSPLVGVRTGKFQRDPRLYLEWGRGHRRRKDGTIASGGLGMGIGTLFEKGRKSGGRIKAARYFRNAVFSTRSRIYQALTTAYRTAVEALNRNV